MGLWFGDKTKRQKSSEAVRREFATGETADQIRKDNTSLKISDKPFANGAQEIAREVQRLIGYDAALVLPVVRRIYQLTNRYPASVKHHDSDPGGLWRHSFDVASACVTHIAKYSQDKPYRIGSFLVGLLHDVGKIAQFRVETAGYDFHPLLLQPLTDGYKITGKVPEGGSYRHHFLSTLLIYPLLGEELIVKLGPALLGEIVEALALSHVTTATSSNPMLLALRDADGLTTKASLDTLAAPAPVSVHAPSAAHTPHQASHQVATAISAPRQMFSQDPVSAAPSMVIPSPPRPPASQDFLGVYLDCLRYKITKEWQENFCYFVFADSGILCIVNPRFTMDLLALVTRRLGRDVPEAIFMEALDRANLVALKAADGRKHFVTMDIRFPGDPRARHLNCLCLNLNRLFPPGTQPLFKAGVTALNVLGGFVLESPVVSVPRTPATYVLEEV